LALRSVKEPGINRASSHRRVALETKGMKHVQKNFYTGRSRAEVV
jgi:hypothetical protein